MAQKYVGIDLGSHRVKIAVVTAGFRGAQLVDTFEEPVASAVPGEGGKTEDADPYLPSLQAALTALRARGLLGEAVGIALPTGTLSYRLLTFPFAEERRIAQTIAFEADGQFPVPLEQLAYGHAVVPGMQGSARALLVATKRERVDQLATIFKRAGAELKAVTSGATAMAQVIETDPGPAPAGADPTAQRVTLVVSFGHNSTELVAIGHKGPLAVRSIRRGGRHVTAAIAKGYGLEPGDAEAAKQRDAFVPHRGQGAMSDEQLRAGTMVAQAIEPIVREIEHTRLWLRSTYRCEVVRLVLAGGGAHLGGLVGYLGEQTALPCELARMKVQGGVRGIEGRDVLPYLAAIGAAFGAARRPAIQLHDATAGQGDGGWVQERISSLAAIGIAVMAFGAIDTIVRVKALDAEREAYAADLEEATKKVLGTAVPVEEVKAKLDEAEGSDVTSLIPQRGALEVLALLAQAATPSDLGRVPMPPPPGAAPAEGEGDGVAADDGGSGEQPPEAAATPAAPVNEIIDEKAGIVVSDELVFQRVDVRERKIELKLEAIRSTAQVRLAYKLRDIACLSNIEKGKAKGDERKTFDMVMDNNCYYASSIGTAESNTASESPSPSEEEHDTAPAGEEPAGEGAG
ncbi:MAG TPA: pilus assembly protein PilM [Nannocystaceae bacterium]|nr:pilus assembly protein PilM [Nannocystaceae bacterium]